MLPAGKFEVHVHGARLTVRALGAGSAMSLGLLELRLPLPTSLRLRNFFKNEARELQEFVSTVNRRAWPATDVKPHARVTDTAVHVWYGTADEASAVLSWRAFDRAELQL